MAIDPQILKIRDKLYGAGFASVRSSKGRDSTLIVDGANVSVKIASPSAAGKWKVNIHRHGVLDESGVDAYLICLHGVPGNGVMPIYLILPAPVNRSCYAFTTSSLIRIYAGNVEDWETLREIVERVKNRTEAA
jgi:hypothetical protein